MEQVVSQQLEQVPIPSLRPLLISCEPEDSGVMGPHARECPWDQVNLLWPLVDHAQFRENPEQTAILYLPGELCLEDVLTLQCTLSTRVYVRSTLRYHLQHTVRGRTLGPRVQEVPREIRGWGGGGGEGEERDGRAGEGGMGREGGQGNG